MGDTISDGLPRASRMSDRTVCPSCERAASAVERITMKALLTSEALKRGVPAQPRYCSNGVCPVVYFDIDDPQSTFSESDLTVSVFAKHAADSQTPVCYCFGVTVGAIRDAENAAAIREMVATEVSAGHCACEVRNPKGGCCLGDLVRLARGREQTARDAVCCESD